MVWEIWKTRNQFFFENRKCRTEKLWEILGAHIKETITLTPWLAKDLEVDSNKKQILQNWGIKQIPQNNSWLCYLSEQMISVEFW